MRSRSTPARAILRVRSANTPGRSSTSTTTTSRSRETARWEIDNACFAAPACGTRMWSSARSPGPVHVAAAMFTPASLIAAATRASAPGVLSMSMTRSTAMCPVRPQPTARPPTSPCRQRSDRRLPGCERRGLRSRVGEEDLLDDAFGGFERAVHVGDPERGVLAGEVDAAVGLAHGGEHPAQFARLGPAPATAGPGVLLPGLVSDADDLTSDAGQQPVKEGARGGYAPVAVRGELERLGVEHVRVDHAQLGVGLLGACVPH